MPLTAVLFVGEVPVGAVEVSVAAHVFLQTGSVQAAELILLTQRLVQTPETGTNRC